MIRLMLALLGCSFFATSSAQGADWILAPSTYTHSPTTGERVTQYAPLPDVYAAEDPSYRKSGFRYTQSNRLGPSGSGGERLHMVEEWGREVRPYEEWQYPFRPYSVPYQAWGPPYGGLSPYFGPRVPYSGRDAGAESPPPYPEGEHHHHGGHWHRRGPHGYGGSGYGGHGRGGHGRYHP